MADPRKKGPVHIDPRITLDGEGGHTTMTYADGSQEKAYRGSYTNPMWGDRTSSSVAGRASLRAFADQGYGESSPYLDQYRQMLFQRLQQPLGAGYMATPYYESLMQGVGQMGRQMGWQQGSRHAASGSLSGPGSGAGRAAQTERGARMMQAQTQAQSAARQQKVAEDQAYVRQLLAGIGGEAGLMSAEFDRAFKQWAAQQGLRQQDAQHQLDKMRMWLGLAGQGATLGVSAYTAA